MKDPLVKTITIVLSLFFFILGLAAVLSPEVLSVKLFQIPKNEAFEWFILSVVVFAFPYLKEFSFMGNGFKVWDEINKTKESLKNLEVLINTQTNESRAYLIKTFSEYIATLHENERNQRRIKLNEIYFKEMGIEVGVVKSALKKWVSEANINECKISDTSDTINEELINALFIFQEKNKVENPDGIFGYFTCKKIKEYIE